MKDFFIKGLNLIGLPYSNAQLDKLIAFYQELSVWNKKTGFLKQFFYVRMCPCVEKKNNL